ncbi:acyl-CoA thioesterase [Algihabitans albus]|uniref:acyl-CoA thioesterase n=1 Tax=Algihabitans albus TaxID=2164067 RepID=UPI000E5CD235|nr:thioesterase family protein [Algihabitans albus]
MFTLPQTIRFQHCDPAGIVFYPRYFEMLNLTVECFFEERLGASFSQLHVQERLAVPTVRIDTEFRAMSRLEDVVDFDLRLTRLGRSSATFTVEGRCLAETRLSAEIVLVAINMETRKARQWPDGLRAKLQEQLEV